MPLDDALSLVSKDFDHYMLSGRPAMGPRRSAPPPAPAPDISHLLGKAASGASLSSTELSAVISALQKQRQDDDMASSSSHNGAIYCGKLNYTLGMDKYKCNLAQTFKQQKLSLCSVCEVEFDTTSALPLSPLQLVFRWRKQWRPTLQRTSSVSRQISRPRSSVFSARVLSSHHPPPPPPPLPPWAAAAASQSGTMTHPPVVGLEGL